jgi:predicted heme/steroid binding protein
MLKKLIKIIVYHNGSDSSELFDNTNHAIEILTNNPLRFTIKKKGEY